MRADAAIMGTPQVAVETEDAELGREASLDEVQVEHGATTDRLTMGGPAPVHMVNRQEATIGLSTASTARAVTVQHRVLEAMMINPPSGTNSLGVSRHPRSVTDRGLSVKNRLVPGIVLPVVLGT